MRLPGLRMRQNAALFKNPKWLQSVRFVGMLSLYTLKKQLPKVRGDLFQTPPVQMKTI
jgi:hypothetical protein